MPRDSVSFQTQRTLGASTLVNRNVTVAGRRTSVRLEPVMWRALADIAARERLGISEICDLVNERRHASSLTAAIRVFILLYFQEASTEEGHLSAGHGRRPPAADAFDAAGLG